MILLPASDAYRCQMHTGTAMLHEKLNFSSRIRVCSRQRRPTRTVSRRVERLKDPKHSMCLVDWCEECLRAYEKQREILLKLTSSRSLLPPYIEGFGSPRG